MSGSYKEHGRWVPLAEECLWRSRANDVAGEDDLFGGCHVIAEGNRHRSEDAEYPVLAEWFGSGMRMPTGKPRKCGYLGTPIVAEELVPATEIQPGAHEDNWMLNQSLTY